MQVYIEGFSTLTLEGKTAKLFLEWLLVLKKRNIRSLLKHDQITRKAYIKTNPKQTSFLTDRIRRKTNF